MGEVIELELHRRDWLVVREKCAACHFTAVGVVMKGGDLDALECGRCQEFVSAVTHFLKNQKTDALAEFERIAYPGDEPEPPEWIPRLESVKT